MAGTDHTQAARLAEPGEGPAIVLVRPQMGENIGAAARAMYNFGLTDMRLVNPRDGWPNEKARTMASGADRVIDNVQVAGSTADALRDVHYVYATTARDRRMVKPVLTAAEAGADMRARAARGERTAILFGRESAGLHNDDIALSDCILTVPVNPAFASINLAQAVLLAGYEWFQAGDDTPGRQIDHLGALPATRAEVLAFFEHLEAVLDASGFLFPPEKRPRMVRNLRNMWHRVELTHQDVQTLRGILVSLTRHWPATMKDGLNPGGATVDKANEPGRE